VRQHSSLSLSLSPPPPFHHNIPLGVTVGLGSARDVGWTAIKNTGYHIPGNRHVKTSHSGTSVPVCWYRLCSFHDSARELHRCLRTTRTGRNCLCGRVRQLAWRDNATCSPTVNIISNLLQQSLPIYLWLHSPCGPWPLLQFLNPYTVDSIPWTGDQPITRLLPTHRTTQTQNKRTETPMSRLGFNPMIPVFKRAKTVHALDCAAIVISVLQQHDVNKIIIPSRLKKQ
jgi:hypothetical protein